MKLSTRGFKNRTLVGIAGSATVGLIVIGTCANAYAAAVPTPLENRPLGTAWLENNCLENDPIYSPYVSCFYEANKKWGLLGEGEAPKRMLGGTMRVKSGTKVAIDLDVVDENLNEYTERLEGGEELEIPDSEVVIGVFQEHLH